MYSKQNIHLHRFCYVHTPIREMISQKIGKTALFVVNFMANVSFTSMCCREGLWVMPPRCIQFHLSQPADWRFTINPAQCSGSADSLRQCLSISLRADEHESERAFSAGSVLEKALSEQSQTQSVQSHVCSFIRFRNGELLFASVYLVLWMFSLQELLKRKRVFNNVV